MLDILQDLLKDPTFQSTVNPQKHLFKANEYIIHQNQKNVSIFLVNSGKVRVIVHAEIKDQSPVRPGIAELGTNDVLGEFSLFDELGASADVIAITDSELIVIDIELFKKYLQENPLIANKVYFQLLRNLVKRLRHADKTILNLYMWGMKAHQLDKHL